MGLSANFQGAVVTIPGVYSTFSVQTSASGLASTGVVCIIGESQSGPSFSQELDLVNSAVGPGSFNTVLSKYGSGQLVDAYQQIVNPSDDSRINGAPTAIYLIKTNTGTKANVELTAMGGGNYALLQDANYGVNGNQIYYTTTSATTDSGISTGPFTWIAPVGTVQVQFVVDGVLNPSSPITIAADTLPVGGTNLSDQLSAAGDITVSGGAGVFPVAGSGPTVAVAVSGNTATFTSSATFNSGQIPAVGYSLAIPAGSALAGSGNANVGNYVVTSVNTSTNVIVAVKLSDAAKSGAVPGTITPPVVVSAVALNGIGDFVQYSPVTITLSTPAAGTAVQGISKSLEWAQQTGGTDLLSRCCYALSTTKSSFVSTAAVPALMIPTSETAVTFNVTQPLTPVTQSFTVGGEIALNVSYKNASATAATITVGATSITTTVTGVSSVNLTLPFNAYTTLGQVATFINSQAGYSCSVTNATLANLPPTALDEGTFGILTLEGVLTGRIKTDAYRFSQAIAGSGLVSLATNPTIGLPALQALPILLSGGSRGATTDATILNALAACESLTCNFVVPLFSQNATADITLGVTDPSSTYTIAAINANTRAHVIKMSTLKRKRNRQACLSILDTFANARNAAANTASALCTMAFQYVNTVNSTGSIVQQQPWMAAVEAAGMQSAAAYRGIFNRLLNISGVVSTGSDFNSQSDDNLEQALQSGLMPLHRLQTGGFTFVSDQTTYGLDNNPIYNSMGAIYNTNIVLLTLSQQLQNSFIGASLADVNASIILSGAEGIFGDLLRQKWIAATPTIPLGWNNGNVTISGPTFVLSVGFVTSTNLYYGFISSLVEINNQTATST